MALVPSANERLLDAEINHGIGLSRRATAIVRAVKTILNKADSELFAKLNDALDRLPTESFTVQRLDDMLTSVRRLNNEVYRRVRDKLSTDLQDLSRYELEFQNNLLTEIPPIVMPVAAVSAEQVYAAAVARPFQGRLLSEWGNGMELTRMLRVRDAISMGYVQNETTAQIIARLRGTRANGYSDGLLNIDRVSAESVVRTAVANIASVARAATYAANADLIKAIRWVSTLDARTSQICRARDGLLYTVAEPHRGIGHDVAWLGGPGMAHWRCRSHSVAVLKSAAELGLDTGDASAGTRASMDGQVPADTTYAQWFKGQSAARQDDIVGPTRGKLYRTGRLTFDRFTDDNGRLYTLDQLRESDRAAFKAARL